MEAITNLLNSGGEITFAALFIALLYYVMKTNENREKDQKATNEKREERYSETIITLSKALSGYEDLKENVNEIRKKLDIVHMEK